MNPEPAMHEIILPLDEQNLAHVLTALALAGIADSLDPLHPESRCCWADDGFKLRLPRTKEGLFAEAHVFVKSIAWVEGIGCNKKNNKLMVEASPHHGLFTAKGGHSGNPLLSYYDQGITSSVFKTFSGQQSPTTPLEQQQALNPPTQASDWLFQRSLGVTSWKFDCRVASHAYDLGFGSNEDQSRDRDPSYPAIELLSIAGAAFFAGPQAWLFESEAICCRAWTEPLSLALASLAAIFQVPSSIKLSELSPAELKRVLEDASFVNGIGGRFYTFATRGNAYGKGAAYRHFPEATLIN
jgi:hypothetical protein